MSGRWSAIGGVLVAMTTAAAGEPPRGLRHSDTLTLPNGLRVIIATPARSALFTEVLLVLRAGHAASAGGREHAYVAAEALAAGAAPAPDRSQGRLARLGVVSDYTVGRQVAVFRYAVPTVHTAAMLAWLARSFGRSAVTSREWDEAIERRAAALDRERADPWAQATTRLDETLWQTGDLPEREAGHAPPGRAALDAIWTELYAPANAVLSVWGAREPRETAALVRETFGRIARRPARPVPIPPEPRRKIPAPVTCVDERSAVPPALLVGLAADASSERAFYAWQIAAHVLGASHSSRLHRALRLDAEVVYTVEAAAVLVTAGSLTLRVATQTSAIGAARQIVLREVHRLMHEPVSGAELELARAIVTSRLQLDRGSLREQFYRQSLAMLSVGGLHASAAAERVLAEFTPATLLEVLRATADPQHASTLVLAARRDALCESIDVSRQ